MKARSRSQENKQATTGDFLGLAPTGLASSVASLTAVTAVRHPCLPVFDRTNATACRPRRRSARADGGPAAAVQAPVQDRPFRGRRAPGAGGGAPAPTQADAQPRPTAGGCRTSTGPARRRRPRAAGGIDIWCGARPRCRRAVWVDASPRTIRNGVRLWRPSGGSGAGCNRVRLWDGCGSTGTGCNRYRQCGLIVFEHNTDAPWFENLYCTPEYRHAIVFDAQPSVAWSS